MSIDYIVTVTASTASSLTTSFRINYGS